MKCFRPKVLFFPRREKALPRISGNIQNRKFGLSVLLKNHVVAAVINHPWIQENLGGRKVKEP